MNKLKYRRLFPMRLRREAFKVALDTRKFEIELYWKRATYFWTFIGAAFAAYGAVQSSTSADKSFLSFFVSCLGLILSLGWVLANRGSKQWQENWEHHVDHLENAVTGPLFKATLTRTKPKGFWEWLDFILVGPSGHSVSKINQLISVYIAAMWFVLVLRTPQSWCLKNWTISELAVLIVTIMACLALLFGSRTHPGPHYHKLQLRRSYFEEDEQSN